LIDPGLSPGPFGFFPTFVATPSSCPLRDPVSSPVRCGFVPHFLPVLDIIRETMMGASSRCVQKQTQRSFLVVTYPFSFGKKNRLTLPMFLILFFPAQILPTFDSTYSCTGGVLGSGVISNPRRARGPNPWPFTFDFCVSPPPPPHRWGSPGPSRVIHSFIRCFFTKNTRLLPPSVRLFPFKSLAAFFSWPNLLYSSGGPLIRWDHSQFFGCPVTSG